MKRKLLWFALFTAIFIWLGKDAQAQNPRPSAAGSAGCVQVHSSTGNTISCGGSTVVASLPSASANANAIYLVHDGTSSSDCTAGGGTSQSLCVSNGSAWVALGGGGSSLTPCGPTVGEVQLFASSTTLGCDAAFVGDAVNHLFKIGGAPITPFPGLYVGPDESTLPVGVQDWTNGVGGTQNVLITSTALTALQIEAAQTGSESSGVLSIVNIGTGSPSAIYTENHSADDSLNLAIQGTAYADFANSMGVWGGYFTAGVLQNVVAAEVGGIVLWQPLFENSGTATTYWSLFAQDLGPVTASITNPYYSWFDSRGVRRVKEDSTFDSVGQAIEALYNPQFTKYTPGAVDYERVILGEWNGNISEVGNYAGGAGVARDFRLLGPTVHIGTASNIANTAFTGAGVNDGVFNGTYTGATLTYCAIIDATGTPDTFKWGTNGGCNNGATGVAITGANQALSAGVEINFATTTGHTLNDKWSVVATAATDLWQFQSATYDTLAPKSVAMAVAPGAGNAAFRWLAGTNMGTCKLVSNAGTSAAEVTIIDNVGGGC